MFLQRYGNTVSFYIVLFDGFYGCKLPQNFSLTVLAIQLVSETKVPDFHLWVLPLTTNEKTTIIGKGMFHGHNFSLAETFLSLTVLFPLIGIYKLNN